MIAILTRCGDAVGPIVNNLGYSLSGQAYVQYIVIKHVLLLN